MPRTPEAEERVDLVAGQVSEGVAIREEVASIPDIGSVYREPSMAHGGLYE
jgi:hypothetical protein